jgi:predicted aspartyl protease
MGTFSHPIRVMDQRGNRPTELQGLVDTGATFTLVPAEVLDQLEVSRARKVRLRLADGRLVERDAGETLVDLDGHIVRTIVSFGDEGDPVLIGAYTLEAALLAVDPAGRRLVPSEGLLMLAVGF